MILASYDTQLNYLDLSVMVDRLPGNWWAVTALRADDRSRREIIEFFPRRQDADQLAARIRARGGCWKYDAAGKLEAVAEEAPA